MGVPFSTLLRRFALFAGRSRCLVRHSPPFHEKAMLAAAPYHDASAVLQHMLIDVASNPLSIV